MHCAKCDKLGIDGNYCPDCGHKTGFSKFPCPECKAPNYVTATFCEHCGKPIHEAARAFREGVKP